jgi:hypothetical protein
MLYTDYFCKILRKKGGKIFINVEVKRLVTFMEEGLIALI